MYQYRRQVDEDEIENEGEETEVTQAQIIYAQMHSRGKNWPRAIGIVEIVTGFIIVILGVVEVFIIPMVESTDGSNLIIIDKSNCYGVGIIAGVVMVLTGSTALRATMSKRNSTVNRFYNLTILSFLVYAGLTILLIVAYSIGWTSSNAYEDGSALSTVHMFTTIAAILGLIFASSALFQYFDIICCGGRGREPLWVQWVQCFCPCLAVGIEKDWRGLFRRRAPGQTEREICFNDPI